MISSARSKDAPRIVSLAFLCLAWPLGSAAWAENTEVELSTIPAVRALAVSGNQSPSLFVPPTILVDEGSGLSIQVTATDPDAADVLNLTQTSPPALGLKLNASVASKLVIANLTGSMGFSDAGTYNIQWSLSDGMNPPVTAQSTLTVREVAPPPETPPISVFPTDVLQDVRSGIFIKGEDFGTSTWVELRGEKGTVLADTVVILSSTALAASVLVPTAMAGRYDVVVTGPAGREQKLPSGIIVSTYQFEAVDTRTGKPLQHFTRAQSMAPKAPWAAFPCEGFNFCSLQDPVGISLLQRCKNAGIDPYFSYALVHYRTTFGGFDRRCWAKLHVRTLLDPVGLSPDPTGGHCHSDVNRPRGAPIDTAGYTTDGTSPMFIVQHRWPEAAGRLEGVLWTTDPNCPGLSDSLDGDYIYCLFAYPFFVTGFGLRTSGPGDEPIGTFPQHPTNWGMTPGMAGALDSVSSDWAAKYPSGPKLQFNDASLPWGGLFDANFFNWAADHCGHRVGVEMDVRSTQWTSRQRRRARLFFENRNFIVHPEKNPPHWHVYYAGPDTFRGPGSPIDWAEQRYK